MMTGDKYRASLDDGRQTYFEGEQILDLPRHPILGLTVDSAAAGYDRFYDPTPGAVPAFMAIGGYGRVYLVGPDKGFGHRRYLYFSWNYQRGNCKVLAGNPLKRCNMQRPTCRA